MALRHNDIAPAFRQNVSAQDYAPKRIIDGVRFIPIKRFVEAGGSFSELGRCNGGELQDLPGFVVRQVSYSTMLPSTIKAFHLHLAQSELWFVPPESRLLMGLLDVRAGSPSEGVSMRFVMGDGQPRFVYIPAGVAHGAANLGTELGQIIYFMDQQFSPDPDKTDEKRLPWDVLGEGFWAAERG